MRRFIVVLALVLLAQAITDKEIIQQALNGLFEENKLADPTTIVPCIDDDTAHKIVVFGGDVLEKAAKGSIKDLIDLIGLIKGFGDQIPQSVKDCLDGNKEFEALGLKYGINNDTDPSVIEKKVIAYATLHYLEVHGWLGSLNTNWKAGKYYQVGFDGATYGHKVLGSAVSEPNLTDKEILQQALNGLFEQNKLADPTTIVPCIDDATAKELVRFIGEVLEKAAKGSVTDLVQLVNLIKGQGDKIPQAVKDCLDGNKEFETLGLKYHIDNNTDSSVIEKKVIAYVTLHYLEVHKWLGDLNNNWKAGKYYQVGFDGATYGHKILGSAVSEPNLTDKEIIQQALNGLFEQNKLADPTTIVPCIDDDTAHKIVVFGGDVLEKAAKGSIKDLIDLIGLIKGFGDQIPQSVKDCLDGNKEFEALGLKYGINNDTDPSVIEKKVIAYATLHYLEVHGWLGSLNTNWKAGKYYQVGFDGATYGHKVLGSAVSEPNLTDKEILQQALNGLFEQNKLADPTTIVPCIDDATAKELVRFIGEVLEKAAKGSVTDLVQLVNLIKGQGDKIPQAVKDCLDGNKEFETLGLKYHIDNNTDSSVIEKKVIAYVTLHYLEVHKWLGDLNNNWKAGKYYQVGFDGATYGHKILGSAVSEPNLTDKEIIQQALNGLFEQNKLADPTTIVPCIDDDTAHKIVVFIGEVLEKAAKISPTDIASLINLIKGFGDQIPQSVKDCLDGNAEFAALGLKYGIDDKTDSSVIEKKVIAYVTLHFLAVRKWLDGLNSNWKAKKYYQVGFDAAGYGHIVLGITPADIKKSLSEN